MIDESYFACFDFQRKKLFKMENLIGTYIHSSGHGIN